ncbi:MAG: efflux RND transporter permease subunit, partial [Planctomycetota bacterium]
APRDAAVGGAGEVAGAIVASTITTLVIFLPLVFVRGVSGVLFSELALVIAFSLVCSLLVSLSLVPVLSARLLRRVEPTGEARAETRLERAYGRLLGAALGAPWLVVAAALVALGGAGLLARGVGTEFLPPSDEGAVRVYGEMENGTRLDLVDAQARKIEERVERAVPEAIARVTTVGPSWRSAVTARGEVQLTLVPASQRSRSNSEVANALREELEGQVAGMRIRTRAPQGQFLLQRVLGSDDGLTVEVRGFDLDVLAGLAERAADIVAAVPGITDVERSQQAGIPETELFLDRDKVADVGLSVRDVTRVLETGFAGTQAGEYRTAGNAYRILVQLEDAERRSIDEVLDLTLSTPEGVPVALRNLVEVKDGTGPLIIERRNQERMVKLTANVAGRPEGDVAREVQAALDALPRPAGHDLVVTGTFEEQEKASRELLVAFLLAIALVYMVLACQYESLRDPLVVMLSVPLAGIGVVVALLATDTTLNLQSGIGCIMLGGIVVNNAILLVDRATRLHRAGHSPREAALEAGAKRLRPILMTTSTTVLALLPLFLGVGEGADAQAPLARAVVGGLIGSTLITLVLIPAVFVLTRPRSRGERGVAA